MQIGKRVWREAFRQEKVGNRRNTLCISRFYERISGGKDPSEFADAFVWCCLTENYKTGQPPDWKLPGKRHIYF